MKITGLWVVPALLLGALVVQGCAPEPAGPLTSQAASESWVVLTSGAVILDHKPQMRHILSPVDAVIADLEPQMKRFLQTVYKGTGEDPNDAELCLFNKTLVISTPSRKEIVLLASSPGFAVIGLFQSTGNGWTMVDGWSCPAAKCGITEMVFSDADGDGKDDFMVTTAHHPGTDMFGYTFHVLSKKDGKLREMLSYGFAFSTGVPVTVEPRAYWQNGRRFLEARLSPGGKVLRFVLQDSKFKLVGEE